MLIHAVEGLAPGKCGKIGTFDTCRSTMFSFVKAKYRANNSKNVTRDRGEIRTMTPKKSQKDCFKAFSHKRFNDFNEKKNREITEVSS
jgi:hypothetical protein